MKRGPKPTPTNLKLIRGNPGRRPLRLDEFKPERGVPACPQHLKGEGRKEYLRIAKILDPTGILSPADRGVLAMLATQWARYVAAEEKIASGGICVAGRFGQDAASPWITVSGHAISIYRTLAAEFGLTPSARTRILPMTSSPEGAAPETDAPGFAGFK